MAEPIRPTDPADEQGRHAADRLADVSPGEVDEAAAARRDLGETGTAASSADEAAETREPLLPPPAVPPARSADEPQAEAARRTDETEAEAVRRSDAPASTADTTASTVRESDRPTVERTSADEEDASARSIEPAPATRKPIEPPAPYRASGTQTGPTKAAEAPTTAVPVAPAPQPVVAPAVQDGPPPPKRRGNRVAGTAWALLAAGLFQLFYFASLAGLTALVSGPASIGPFLGAVIAAKWGVFAWLPVLFLFLLHELTVLIAGRAGRFFWVVASGVIAILVYALSVVLVAIVVRGAMPDPPTLLQTFLNPTFILIGVVAREVVLWTGFAAGARGVRIRHRDREDRERYDRDLAARTATAS